LNFKWKKRSLAGGGEGKKNKQNVKVLENVEKKASFSSERLSMTQTRDE